MAKESKMNNGQNAELAKWYILAEHEEIVGRLG